MASLTIKEKNNIKNLKSQISKDVLIVAKIQDTTSIEQELLQMAIDYISTDHIGNYKGRMAELNQFHYMIQGILYAHLDSKQIKFGSPTTLEIPAPNSIARYIHDNESYGTNQFFSPDDEPI